jgi:hypothetical protein
MSELPLLVSCDCGYRDVRQGVKAHQKTCGVRIVPGQPIFCAQQEQDATERGESYLHIYFLLLYSYLEKNPFFRRRNLYRQIFMLIISGLLFVLRVLFVAYNLESIPDSTQTAVTSTGRPIRQ